MANLQPSYPTASAVAVPGMIANEERANKVSRTVENAAGIAFGQPAFRGSNDHGAVAGGTFAATGAGTADGTNVGTTTITASPAVAAGAKAGRYIIEQLSSGATGVVRLVDPDGLIVGDGVIGTPFTLGGIGPVTLTTGGSPAVGDRFYVDVTYTANTKFLGIAVMNPAVPAVASNPDFYPQYATGSFMTQGVIWGVAGASVVPGGLVYWNPATGRYTSNTAHIRIPNSRFDTTAADGEFVKIATRLRDA